jgi:hypothetical protein
VVDALVEEVVTVDDVVLVVVVAAAVVVAKQRVSKKFKVGFAKLYLFQRCIVNSTGWSNSNRPQLRK